MSVPFIARWQMACLAPKSQLKEWDKGEFQVRAGDWSRKEDGGRRQLHEQGEAHDERCSGEKPGDAGRMRARQTWKDRQERGAKGREGEGSARRRLFYRRVCMIPATTATTQIKHMSCMFLFFFPAHTWTKGGPCVAHMPPSESSNTQTEDVFAVNSPG